MPGGRPARPMFPPAGPADEGALSLEDAAAFLAVSLRTLKEIAYEKREIDVLHFGRKPVVLRRQLVELLERRLEEARSKRV